MSYLRDTVIILKNEPFREHDAWVTMYGKEHGKLIAVARGARRHDAKSVGHLEPLSEAQVMIAKGATFDKLAVATTIHPRIRLRQELGWLTLCSSFVDLVDALTHPGVAEPAIFHLLTEMVSLSEASSISLARHELLLAAATLKLVDLLGYAPNIAQLETSENAKRILLFSRHAPLKTLLTITAPTQIFFETSSIMHGALKQTPLHKEPHGIKTLAAMLG